MLAHGATTEEILEEYQGLKREDIQACFLFATKSLGDTDFMPLTVETAGMRFLVDECTGSKVATWLRGEGHEVFSVFDEARGIEDDEVIQKAFDENWI